MKRTIVILAVTILCVAPCPAHAVWSVAEQGTWPDSWPEELEPLREQSRSLTGGLVNLTVYEIPFTDRDTFEAAWPHLLKVKSDGAPIILLHGPKKRFFGTNPGVCIRCPPESANRPEKPLPGDRDPRQRWMWTTFIELVVDGEIVDLNRIPLPPDTPIIDERFEDERAGKQRVDEPDSGTSEPRVVPASPSRSAAAIEDKKRALPASLSLATRRDQQSTGKWTAIYAIHEDQATARKVASIPEFPIIHSPEISPDKKWVAVDGWASDENLRDARVLLVRMEDGAVLNLGKGAMPNWSPDGKWLALCKYAPQGGVYIRTVDGMHERLIDADGWGIQWAPDGMKAAYSRDGNILIYDFISDTVRSLFPSPSPYARIYWNATWSPDSKAICFRGRRRDGGTEIAIVSTEDGSLQVCCDGQNYNPDIAWHPDGDLIALPRRRQRGGFAQIYTINPNRFEPATRLPGQPSDRHNAGMSWSRDGELFVFVSRP